MFKSYLRDDYGNSHLAQTRIQDRPCSDHGHLVHHRQGSALVGIPNVGVEALKEDLI